MKLKKQTKKLIIISLLALISCLLVLDYKIHEQKEINVYRGNTKSGRTIIFLEDEKGNIRPTSQMEIDFMKEKGFKITEYKGGNRK